MIFVWSPVGFGRPENFLFSFPSPRLNMKLKQRASKKHWPVYRVIAQDCQWRVLDVRARSKDDAVRQAMSVRRRRFRKADWAMKLVGVRRMDANSPAEYFDTALFHSPTSHEDLQ